MNRAKRNYISVLIFSLLIFTTSCVDSISSGNFIIRKELNEQEEQLVNLVSTSKEIFLYDYNINDNFKSCAFWVERYIDGELEALVGLSDTEGEDPISLYMLGENNILDKKKNSIAVSVSKKDDWEWEISNNGVIMHFSTPDTSNFSSNALIELDEKYEIINEEEIILLAGLFTNNDELAVFMSEEYIENDNLKNWDLAYIIKCKFSERETKELLDEFNQ